MFSFPPTNVLRLLFSSAPLKSFARPPVPYVRVGLPLMMISPPEDVLAEEARPALRIIASSEVEVVLMFSDKVRLPFSVSIKTVPLEKIPSGLTEPISRVFTSRYTIFPRRIPLVPPAIVATLFEEFCKVNVPPPCNPNPLAVSAADWETVPLACKLMSAAVAVKAELMERSPP